MQISLCSVPVENPGAKLRRERSDGPTPIMPKIAITSLNHWSEKNGFPTCKFYDVDMLYPSDEEVEKYFTDNKSDVVGLSAVVSTSYKQVKRLARIIKKVNESTVIVCGGYLTAASNTILRKTKVDICVVGDGEMAWVGILNFVKKHLEAGKNQMDFEELLKVKGIAALDKDKKLRFSGYGQTLPTCHMTFPSFEYLKTGLQNNEKALKNYFRPIGSQQTFSMDDRSFEKGRRPMISSIYLSKGCVAQCTFCQRGSKGYKVYDLGKLEIHLKNLRDNYNVGFLMVDDENFGSNKKYTYQVAELLNKYDMLWSVGGVRCTSVEKEDLMHYKKNGCASLKFGIESGHQSMLDIMEKKFTVDDIKKGIFNCYDIGLYSPLLGFMVGMPGENLETIRGSGKLLGELAAHIRVPVGLIFSNTDIPYAIPLVGTPLYEYGKQLGLIGSSADEEEKYLEITSNIAFYKRFYINFNGAPMSEVVFWEMLVFLEATRTYEKLMKNKTVNEELKNKFIRQLKIQNLNPQVRAKQKKIQVMGAASEKELDLSFSQYFISNFLKQHIVFNKFVAKLPRFLVDPFVRYSLYFEYLIQKYLLKDSHNLHKNSKGNSKIRITYDEIDPLKTTQKDRSLRTIVKNKMAQLKRTEDEITASSLTAGP